MPRQVRLDVPGALHYTMRSWIEGTKIFKFIQKQRSSTQDYGIPLAVIGDVANLYNLRYVCYMVRQARLDATGVLHHVMARGIERRPIFIDDRDIAPCYGTWN